MPAQEKINCIGCPLGCRVTVRIDKKGKIAGMEGAECKQGEKYVQKEFSAPVRTLTATVRTGSESYPLLPVRTSLPVPRGLLRDIMLETVKIKVKPPIEAGDVIAENVLDTGSDFIATSDWRG
jgi:CxxC motif-containing protein